MSLNLVAPDTRRKTTVFRHAAFAEAAPHAAHVRPDHHPAGERGCQEDASMKASVADAAGRNASPSGAIPDTDALI